MFDGQSLEQDLHHAANVDHPRHLGLIDPDAEGALHGEQDVDTQLTVGVLVPGERDARRRELERLQVENLAVDLPDLVLDGR